jgi:putative intracellular protease/amidase
MTVAVLLFDDFETLDVFGPVEVFGRLKDDFNVEFYSLNGGIVTNNHGVAVHSNNIAAIKNGVDIFLIPGGYGTRPLVNNAIFLHTIRQVAAASKFVLTVCTGSGLLAKTGLLDGREATSNKRALTWAMGQGQNVNWVKKARWTIDGKYYTSSGVSAGIDMSLGFIAGLKGLEFASEVAAQIEYTWQQDKDVDEFYIE